MTLVWELDLKQPRADQIHSSLRSAIINVTLRPRLALSESTICVRAKVSRTPVREAFIRLSQEGLVDVFPQVGSFVAPIRLSKVVEGHFIREALELAILKRAAARWQPQDTERAEHILSDQERSTSLADAPAFYVEDQAFHELFALVAGMAGVARVIGDAATDLLRVRRLSTPIVGHMAEALAEHRLLLSAISAGDLATASSVLSQHLGRVFNTVRRLTRSYQEYFEGLDDPAMASALKDFVTSDEVEVVNA